MPTALALQPYGLRGAGLSLVAVDESGMTIPTHAIAFGMVAAVFVNSGGSPETVIVRASQRCSTGRVHDIVTDLAIPADGERHIVPLSDPRFSGGVSLEFEAGQAATLTIAAANMGSLAGIGQDAETPTALGASPGTVPMFREGPGSGSDVPAAADGMLAVLSGLDTVVYIRNAHSSESRTVYVNASNPCSHGFNDDVPLTIDPGTVKKTLALNPKRFGGVAAFTYPNAADLHFVGVYQEEYKA